MDLHCVTDKLSKATLLITHKEEKHLSYSSLDGLTLQAEQQQNNFFFLKEQGGLMCRGTSCAEQQRQMFYILRTHWLSSEHIQTDNILISFSLKTRTLL